eukprot:25896-Eustigmatos_ZCMA.PRE.1
MQHHPFGVLSRQWLEERVKQRAEMAHKAPWPGVPWKASTHLICSSVLRSWPDWEQEEESQSPLRRSFA